MGAGRGVASGGDTGETRLGTLMAQLMKDDTTADCVIVVDGREFPCHKCILSTASDVFRTMLYKKGLKQWESRIKLDGVSAAAWDTLQNYCYKQSVSGTRGKPRLSGASVWEYSVALRRLVRSFTRARANVSLFLPLPLASCLCPFPGRSLLL